MKHLPPYTLLLLSVLYHSFTDADGRCEPLFVRIGEIATIKCNVSNPDQDGVYLYKQYPQGSEESLMYYYKDGTLTAENPVVDRVTTRGNFGNFSVFLSNVRANDQGVYWCSFNKLANLTISDRTFLFTQPKEVLCVSTIYLGVICGQFVLILLLVLILVKLCCKCTKYTPKQESSNGVYEDMRGNTTTRALNNPAYESSQRLVRA